MDTWKRVPHVIGGLMVGLLGGVNLALLHVVVALTTPLYGDYALKVEQFPFTLITNTISKSLAHTFTVGLLLSSPIFPLIFFGVARYYYLKVPRKELLMAMYVGLSVGWGSIGLFLFDKN